jgi:hypothetical protein
MEGTPKPYFQFKEASWSTATARVRGKPDQGQPASRKPLRYPLLPRNCFLCHCHPPTLLANLAIITNYDALGKPKTLLKKATAPRHSELETPRPKSGEDGAWKQQRKVKRIPRLYVGNKVRRTGAEIVGEEASGQ